MEKFKKGDKVRIRHDFASIDSGIRRIESEDFQGKEGIIIGEFYGSYYIHILDTRFHSDHYCFNIDWFMTEDEVKDFKVRLEDIKKLLL